MTDNKIIKVLIVEDTEILRILLTAVFESSNQFKIIGMAKNGHEAIDLVNLLKPDVVLMDLHMPKMNGIDAIRTIMSTTPLPIIAMSASSELDEVINSIHALEEGAIAFVEKPRSVYDAQYEVLCDRILQTVKLMSEVKVVRRRGKHHPAKMTKNKPQQNNEHPHIKNDIQLIAIGVSTGGPLVLREILSLLPDDYPPILIVQHIVPGFVAGLIQWLYETTNCRIQIAENYMLPKRGNIYFAPDYYHMGINDNMHIFLNENSNNNIICPSVNFLFNTVAHVIKDKAIGILLSGMGSDGVSQLKVMRENGAITIAQSRESSLIYGMPGLAMETGAATYQLHPEEIASIIASLQRGAQ